MPEIWLKYGRSDVVLDIKYENLFKTYQAIERNDFSNEELDKIERIKLCDNMLVFAFSAGREIAVLCNAINRLALRNNVKINFGILPHLRDAIKKKMQNINAKKRENLNNETININNDVIDSKNLENDPINENIIFNEYNFNRIDNFNKFSNILFLSKVAYDPLFGFSGSLTNFLKNYDLDRMGDAFNERKNNSPSPGVITEPLKIALEYANINNQNACSNNRRWNCDGNYRNMESIEIVTNYAGSTRIYHGDLVNNFQSGIDDFAKDTKIDTDFTRSLIVDAGSEIDNHLILTESLNSMWNSIHAVKEHGTIILITENSFGLGEGALKMFIEGRLSVDPNIRLDASKKYLKGMEHLLYVEEFRNKIELGILSSLPEYFSTKLGFSSFKNMREVMEHLLERNGKNHKIAVLSDPDRLLLTKTNQ